MKNNKPVYELVEKINNHLAATPPEKRPKLGSTRQSISSVAYQAAGYVQATDHNGNVQSVPVETARAWLAQ